MSNQRLNPPWRSWYKTARWQELRKRVFLRDLFKCQCGCGRLIVDASQLVADHKKPHRGDPVLFWDENNIQTLFKACHDTIKREDERATLHQRGVWH